MEIRIITWKNNQKITNFHLIQIESKLILQKILLIAKLIRHTIQLRIQILIAVEKCI